MDEKKLVFFYCFLKIFNNLGRIRMSSEAFWKNQQPAILYYELPT